MPAEILWLSTETPDVHGQGGQRRQYHQIRALVERGHRVHVLSLGGAQDDTSVRELGTVQRLHTRFRGRRVPGGLIPLRRTLASPRWDAMVVPHLESWRLARYLGPVRIPALVDVHNVMSGWLEQHGRYEEAVRYAALERQVLAEADAVTVCSEAELQRLPSGGRAERHVAFHGVDAADWRPVPRRVDAPVVAMFGSWGWEPNREGLEWFLAQVWPAVRATVPDAQCRIAGTALPDVTGLAGVQAWGRVPDLAAFMAEATVAPVPVLRGVGASVKFADALASGAHVIATPDGASAHPGAPATVSADPHEWAVTIAGWLQHRTAEPDEARAFALTHLTWEAATEPLHEWLEEVTAVRNASSGAAVTR